MFGLNHELAKLDLYSRALLFNSRFLFLGVLLLYVWNIFRVLMFIKNTTRKKYLQNISNIPKIYKII